MKFYPTRMILHSDDDRALPTEMILTIGSSANTKTMRFVITSAIWRKAKYGI